MMFEEGDMEYLTLHVFMNFNTTMILSKCAVLRRLMLSWNYISHGVYFILGHK